MAKALGLGWAQYLKDPARANQHMAGINKAMDLKTFAESAQAQKNLIQTEETDKNGIGSMTLSRWETLASQLLELKLIKAQPAAKDLFESVP